MKKTAPNPLKIDPTRTITLRRAFASYLSSEFGGLRKAITTYLESPTLNAAYSYSSTQFDIIDPDVLRLHSALRSYLPADSVIKFEDEPHITIRYGLFDQPNMVDGVRTLASEFGPITVTLGKTSIFNTPKGDVLKVEVESERLRELNARLALLPNYDNYPTYQPHITIAYMVPGSADRWVGNRAFEGKSLTFDVLQYSDSEGTKTPVILAGKPSFATNATPTAGGRWVFIHGHPIFITDGGVPHGGTPEAHKEVEAGHHRAGHLPEGHQWVSYKGHKVRLDAEHRIVEGPKELLGRKLQKKESPKEQPHDHPKPKTDHPPVHQAPLPKDFFKDKPEASSTPPSPHATPNNIADVENFVKAKYKTKLVKGDKQSQADYESKSQHVANELQRLEGLKAVQTTLKNRTREQYLKVGHDASQETGSARGASGSYLFGEGIKINREAPLKDTPLQLGNHTVSQGEFGGIFRHEFGHDVFNYGLSRAKQQEFLNKFDKYVGTSTVSRYGGKDAYELFSEAFSAYTHRDYKSGTLPKDLEQWLDKNVRGDTKKHETHTSNSAEEPLVCRVSHSPPIEEEYEEAPTSNARPTLPQRHYGSQAEAAVHFETWLQAQVNQRLLSPASVQKWRAFIQKGYEKGTARAFDDTKRARRDEALRSAGFVEGRREQFIRQSIGRSVSAEKLKLLQQNALSEVKGMSDDLINRGRRALTDGLVRGLSPTAIAKNLASELDVSLNRAETIAYTELVRAHADGQLEAMEQLGVDTVGIAVEWSTASNPCKMCEPMKGVILKLSEARGMIPRHPRCRCAWIPANIGEDASEKKGQIRAVGGVRKAVAESRKAGEGFSNWKPSTPIAGKRPTSVLNADCSCSEHMLRFESLLRNLGCEDEPTDNAKLSGGEWKTIHGVHVYIKGGQVVAGPKALKGKTESEAHARGKTKYESGEHVTVKGEHFEVHEHGTFVKAKSLKTGKIMMLRESEIKPHTPHVEVPKKESHVRTSTPTPSDHTVSRTLQEHTLSYGGTVVGGEIHYKASWGYKNQTHSLKEVEIHKLKPEEEDYKNGASKAHAFTDKLAEKFRAGEEIAPIVVRENDDGSHTIIDGHHRWEGARKAGLHKMHAIVLKDIN